MWRKAKKESETNLKKKVNTKLKILSLKKYCICQLWMVNIFPPTIKQPSFGKYLYIYIIVLWYQCICPYCICSSPGHQSGQTPQRSSRAKQLASPSSPKAAWKLRRNSARSRAILHCSLRCSAERKVRRSAMRAFCAETAESAALKQAKHQKCWSFESLMAPHVEYVK